MHVYAHCSRPEIPSRELQRSLITCTTVIAGAQYNILNWFITLLHTSCIPCKEAPFIHSFIHSFNSFIHFHSIDMCRMWKFRAVLRIFFHSSLLHTLSFHPFPPTSLPSLSGNDVNRSKFYSGRN